MDDVMYQALYLQEQEENKQLKAQIEELEGLLTEMKKKYDPCIDWEYIKSINTLELPRKI